MIRFHDLSRVDNLAYQKQQRTELLVRRSSIQTGPDSSRSLPIFPERFACKNVQLPSGSSFREDRAIYSDMTLKHPSIRLHLIGRRETEVDCASRITCSVIVLAARVAIVKS